MCDFQNFGLIGAASFEKISKNVFEVILQPPKTHFLTFSKVPKHILEKKSETKIMKITHCEGEQRMMMIRDFLRNEFFGSFRFFFTHLVLAKNAK